MSVWIDAEAMSGVPQIGIEREPDDATTKYKIKKKRFIKRKGKRFESQFLTFDELRVSEKGQYGLAKTIDLSDLKKYKKEGWTRSERYNTSDEPKPPNNKKEIPCKGCSMQIACKAKWNPSEGLTCQAYRAWIGSGDYNPSQIEMKLKRVA